MADHLEPFKVFKIYHAVFLHFTTDYDYQQYNGGAKYTELMFENRADKYSWHKLVRALTYFNETYFEYYCAWCFYRVDKWVNTKTLESMVPQFESEWRSYSTRRSHAFSEDLKKIPSLDPKLLYGLSRTGEIHDQTLLLLDKFKGVIELMNEVLRGQYLWDAKYQKLTKFRPFYFAAEPAQEIYYKPLIMETFK